MTTITNTQETYSSTQWETFIYNLNFVVINFITATSITTIATKQMQVINVILQPQPGNVTRTVSSSDRAPITGATIRLID